MGCNATVYDITQYTHLAGALSKPDSIKSSSDVIESGKRIKYAGNDNYNSFAMSSELIYGMDLRNTLSNAY